VFVEGVCNTGEVGNMVREPVEETEERLKFLAGLGGSPVENVLDFERVWGSALTGADVTEDEDFRLEEFAFLTLDAQVELQEAVQHLVHHSHVGLRRAFRENNNVVDVNLDAREAVEDIGHDALKNRREVGETKRASNIMVLDTTEREGGLFTVSGVDEELVETIFEVNFRKVVRAGKGEEDVMGDVGKLLMVQEEEGIDFANVNACAYVRLVAIQVLFGCNH
jgi:hypothetical protein